MVWMRLVGLAIVTTACGHIAFDPVAQRDATVSSDGDDGDAIRDSGVNDVAVADVAADAQMLAACITDVDLAACYAFEGDTLDATANNNDGAPISVSYTAGRSGQAVLVDGNSRITVPDSNSIDLSSGFTIETWVRLDVSNAARVMIADHNNDFALYLDPGAVPVCDLSIGGNSRRTPASPTIGTGAWRHVACTYDGAKIVAFVDGSMVAMLSVAGTAGPTTDPMQIGGNQPDSGNPAAERMTGAIDQFRLWRVVRTAQQLCMAAGTC